MAKPSLVASRERIEPDFRGPRIDAVNPVAPPDGVSVVVGLIVVVFEPLADPLWDS